MSALIRKRQRRHRRQSKPPKESIFSSVVGEFLDPIDALFAIVYSILFALLFTLSYGILIYRGALSSTFAEGYGQQLFINILGAVTAWGIIEGVLYAVAEVLARRERYRLLQSVQSSDSEEEATTAIADELDFVLEPIVSVEQRQDIYRHIRAYLSEAEPRAIGLKREDVIGAVAMVLVYVVAVLPSLLPLLMLPNDTAMAIRISNFVSFVVIFFTGYVWGIHTDTNPWKIGLLLSSVCLAMVLLAMWLGG